MCPPVVDIGHNLLDPCPFVIEVPGRDIVERDIPLVTNKDEHAPLVKFLKLLRVIMKRNPVLFGYRSVL